MRCLRRFALSPQKLGWNWFCLDSLFGTGSHSNDLGRLVPAFSGCDFADVLAQNITWPGKIALGGRLAKVLGEAFLRGRRCRIEPVGCPNVADNSNHGPHESKEAQSRDGKQDLHKPEVKDIKVQRFVQLNRLFSRVCLKTSCGSYGFPSTRSAFSALRKRICAGICRYKAGTLRCWICFST
jgi:hypothetical protein